MISEINQRAWEHNHIDQERERLREEERAREKKHTRKINHFPSECGSV